MASIQSLGVGSGLLTNDLVDDIIEAERAATDLRLDRREEKVEDQISAYGEVQSAIGKLQSSSQALASVSTIRETTANSSNESAVTATTNNQAEVGNYAIRVDNVAEAHSVASQRYNAVTDTVGTGTLSFRFGAYEYNEEGDVLGFDQNSDAQEFEIEISSGNNTLTGIRDAINREDNGVQASLVNDGQGYRLLFTSEKTGESNAMEITATGDSGLQALTYNAAQNDPEVNMAMTQQAMDANLFVNGLQVTSESNELTEVARGVTINLKDATNGSTVNISVTRDPSRMVELVENFIESYNEFKDLSSKLTDFESTEELGGLLVGDSTLRQVENQVRRALTQLVEGLENSRYRTLADIGIFTDRNDNFKLALNSEKLTTAFQTAIDDVTGLFATRTTTSDSLINYIAKGSDTQPGEYDIDITQIATQGKFEGLGISGFEDNGEVVISGSNDRFSINIDGNASEVKLEQGTYTSGADLAQMIQNSINNTSRFVDRGVSVTVEFDAIRQGLDITSSRYGSQSQVFFEELGPNVANTLGFVSPGQGELDGARFSALGTLGFGAATTPANREIFEDQGVNFANSPVDFNLTVDGFGAEDGTYSISLNEDWSDIIDNNGEVVEARDRDDVLSYINAELNAAGLSGVVSAQFNSANRLVFATDPAAGQQTLTLSDVTIGGAGTDFLGLASAEGTTTSGVTIDPDTSFEIEIANRYGVTESELITVAPGQYETPEDLAAAIESAINADPNISAAAAGATTLAGSRNISNAIDFSDRAGGFQFRLNGTLVDVAVEDNAGSNNIDSIQAALDDALVAAGFDAGDVVASMQSNGLVLETLATGSSETLNVISDGRGDRTDPGAIIDQGIDFSENPSEFVLRMDSTNITVSLTEDMSNADPDEVLAYVQQRLDQGLITAGGGGRFSGGDIKAQLDEDGRLFFESQSRNGQQTTATFGARASLEVVSADANATSTLGIEEQAANIAGRDAFGLDKGVYNGFDAQAQVSYEENELGRGGFSILFDNETRIDLNNISASASAQLGLTPNQGTASSIQTGKDVEGTINGTPATGRGQVLTAGSGAEAATNGYILGSQAFDFSSAVTLDSSNNSFSLIVDGVATNPINLPEQVYANGSSLAAAMTQAINADTNLAGEFISVEVQYDENTDTFGIFSTSTGEDSSVRIADIDDQLSNITGLSVNSETVDGKAATGEADPAEGIILRVLGGETGSRGTVQITEGVFEQLGSLFSDMLSSRGSVTRRIERLESQRTDILEERSRFDRRMDAQRARLQAQFSFNDRIISQINSTGDFLTQQFEIMNGMLSNRNK